eukprot:CAMPEP_0116832030 /NCGR_PEP_ID=MMETSP0418-20121206/5666_1 /TAXON_ID=1158023 /ORGANISM="Astrosyne radiata, Strain 13vi08-1A" /LENGTH=69 /DNA_ID=CAMNT_0004461347 /DNA_START=165 /DNA_END=374 /DNA_ORIENTATION=-
MKQLYPWAFTRDLDGTSLHTGLWTGLQTPPQLPPLPPSGPATQDGDNTHSITAPSQPPVRGEETSEQER